jgi:hypothetical protein
MKLRPTLLAVLLAAALLPAAGALAVPARAPVLTTGAVVGLIGTPHIWIADGEGKLHWAGDTRALAGKTVDWNTRSDVTLAELQALQRGDPWLSAGLLKDGEPIYLVKWEIEASSPNLFQIQSIKDVELFGINGENYGSLVLERPAWEQRYGMSAGSLSRGVLAQAAVQPTATAAPQATATPAPVVLKAELVSVSVSGKEPSFTALTTVKISGATPRSRLKASMVGREYECSPGCAGTRASSWGPTDIGDADGDGNYTFEDRHFPHSEYVYTFYDVSGRTTKLKLDDDFKFLG